MELLLSDPIGYLDTFLLIMVRVLGITVLVPFFGNSNVPMMTKIILSFFISVIVFSTASIVAPVSSSNIFAYGGVVAIEFVTGLAIGFGAYVVYSILSLAGQFIDMQIGFSMVNVFDPLSEIQLTITGNLYYYLLMIITLILNAHHYFLKTLIDSFFRIPLGGAVLSPALEEATVGFIPAYFSMALRIATPIFFVMLITNVVLGILARTVPQLNMFVVGFPIKILFGLSTIFVMLAFFDNISEMLIGESQKQMMEIIEGMMP